MMGIAQVIRYRWLLLVVLLLSGCAGLPSLSDLIESEGEAPGATPQVEPTVQFQMVVLEPTPTPVAVSKDSATSLLFVSNRGRPGTTDIYQMNADGSGLVRLTDDPANESGPRWSPDRRQIAFASDRTGTSQIYLMTVADSSVTQLTDHPPGAVSPAWSPDSAQIAFAEPGPASDSILLVESRPGAEVVRVPTGVSAVSSLAWSPQSDRVAFSALSGGERDVFAIDINQQDDVVNLTHHAGNDDNPAWSPKGDRLVFQTDRDGDDNIYVMQSDGTRQTPLTVDPASDVEPDWSSDANTIAFSSDRGGSGTGTYDVHVMSDSGADQRALTPFAADDRQPRFPPPPAPPADELVTAVGFSNDLWDLYIVNADGTKRSQLTKGSSADNTMPAWSPDGQRLAFASSRGGNFDIYIMNADGSGEPIAFSDHAGADMHPDWAPDGTQIAFESNQDEGDWDIWVMNADGSQPRNLTANAQSNDGNPAWSPDGQRIAFSSDRAGNYDIYVMNADASGEPVQLTSLRGDDFHPAWAPDGTSIVFRSISPETGRRQLYVMSSDGWGVQPLFSSQANDDSPDWSLDGLRIAFASDRASPGDGVQGGNYDIYLYDLTTDTVTRVTQGDRDARYPAWRPPKQKIAP
jgi:Tol biopolymer transport system component